MVQIPGTEIDDVNPDGFRGTRVGTNKRMVGNKVAVYGMLKDKILGQKCFSERPLNKPVNGELERGEENKSIFLFNAQALD